MASHKSYKSLLKLMNNNILLSSAGKRVELLEEFKREYPEGKIFAVDLNPFMAPACHVAYSAFEVPKVTSPEYCDSLLDICKKNNVKIVIPTIDTELLILSQQRGKFLEEGIHIMVSNCEFIDICRDKRKTMLLFDKLNIKYPKPIDKYHPVFPLFAKPYDGSLSTNIHLIKTPDELTKDILNDPKLIFMEYINKGDYKEYTVDMYYGKDGKVKSIVPRERLEIRSGEINKGITRKNYIVEFLKERMEHLEGVRGCICIQLFYRDKDNDILGIEINPRFGGGYPLSYYAGANFPKMMINEYILNEEIEYEDNWRDGTIMLRYDSQVITNFNSRIIDL